MRWKPLCLSRRETLIPEHNRTIRKFFTLGSSREGTIEAVSILFQIQESSDAQCRPAAQAMYIRSRKLSELQGDPSQYIHLAELQSESLSMALNTLSLLDGKNPWIVVPIISGSSRVSRAPLMNGSLS